MSRTKREWRQRLRRRAAQRSKNQNVFRPPPERKVQARKIKDHVGENTINLALLKELRAYRLLMCAKNLPQNVMANAICEARFRVNQFSARIYRQYQQDSSERRNMCRNTEERNVTNQLMEFSMRKFLGFRPMDATCHSGLPKTRCESLREIRNLRRGHRESRAAFIEGMVEGLQETGWRAEKIRSLSEHLARILNPGLLDTTRDVTIHPDPSIHDFIEQQIGKDCLYDRLENIVAQDRIKFLSFRSDVGLFYMSDSKEWFGLDDHTDGDKDDSEKYFAQTPLMEEEDESHSVTSGDPPSSCGDTDEICGCSKECTNEMRLKDRHMHASYHISSPDVEDQDLDTWSVEVPNAQETVPQTPLRSIPAMYDSIVKLENSESSGASDFDIDALMTTT